ncbi:hypothetical protein ACQPYA_19625 [Micromonospora sp. CA-263727]|uniref:hypothetical protein n=1 Tax=Micromonospora sp. CA-263727 TaxID=3239967 RepID=UPI003D8AC939
MLDSAAPQLVIDSRMLCIGWLPADPDVAVASVPASLNPRSDRRVIFSQQVVDDEVQSPGFGAYDLTFLGIALTETDNVGGVSQSGWGTHCLISSRRLLGHARARGIPAMPGRTAIHEQHDKLVTETRLDGVPVIRTSCRIGNTPRAMQSGHHQHFVRRDGHTTSIVYTYMAELVAPFEIESVEFLEPEHPIYALRPANPLDIAWAFYSPRTAFAYPGIASGNPRIEAGR